MTSRPAAPQHLRDLAMASRGGEMGDQTDQESRSAGHRARPNVTDMDIGQGFPFVAQPDDPDHPGSM